MIIRRALNKLAREVLGKFRITNIVAEIPFLSKKVTKFIEWAAVIISIIAGIFGIIQFTSTQERKNEANLEELLLIVTQNQNKLVYVKKEIDKLAILRSLGLPTRAPPRSPAQALDHALTA